MLFFVFDWNSIRFAKFIVVCCLIVVHLSESDLLVYPTLGRCFVHAIYMFKSPRRLQGLLSVFFWLWFYFRICPHVLFIEPTGGPFPTVRCVSFSSSFPLFSLSTLLIVVCCSIFSLNAPQHHIAGNRFSSIGSTFLVALDLTLKSWSGLPDSLGSWLSALN